MYKSIEKCRICGNSRLIEVLDLGEQFLTGIFHYPHETVDKAPLVLVKCFHEDSSKCCGLVQLKHTYDLSTMYGKRYGYRSSLNRSMVEHLHAQVQKILSLELSLTPEDLVIDIGSNDGTTLNAYPENSATLLGIDPTARYFKDYYKDKIHIIDAFFSAQKVRNAFPQKKAKIITSFSMFYDLEDPQAFAGEIAELLDDNGIWVFEQSYLPLMLQNNSFDTICHEHLEYYSLHPIVWLCQRAKLKIIDVQFNDTNGGSFCVYAAKEYSPFLENKAHIQKILEEENAMQLHTLQPFKDFCARIHHLKNSLIEKLTALKRAGKSIYGLGASTKGNVLLQYYNLDTNLIPSIGEVNADKFGKLTPGSHIPIEDEENILAQNPDYLLVLPWHFKSFFQTNPRLAGTRLIFPLPSVEEVP